VIAGGLSVMVAGADLVVSVLLVAVSVTVEVAVIVDGAVYVTPLVEEALSVPAPLPILQVTPALAESFATVVVKALLPPPFNDIVAGLTVTAIACVVDVEVEVEPPLPQPARRTNMAKKDKPIPAQEKMRNVPRIAVSDRKSCT
jgi:hypothetical protein